jgi:outer membrane protein insertion porin family
MRTRAPLFLLSAALVGSLAAFLLAGPRAASASSPARQQPGQTQQLVEDVQIEGNRRMSDEGVLYYVQTRPGDPYNPAQVQRDLQALLALPFFDKTETRVSTTQGPRGGIVVVFTVAELPVIRDLTFSGMKAVSEADALKAFRENRVGVSKEATYDQVKVRAAERTIKELLAAKGYPNATVTTETETVSAQSVAVEFKVEQGDRVRVVDIDFEGNQIFSDGELRGAMTLVKEAGLISRFKGQDILDTRKLEYDLGYNVTNYMRSKGYLQARTLEPRIEDAGRKRTGFPVLPLPILSSTDDALRIVVPVNEGKIFRVGEVKVEGNSIIDESVIRAILGLKQGDVANGQRLYKALQEDLKKAYGRSGFIQYDYDVEPSFRDNAQNPKEGIADFQITITEGKQFQLRRLEFLGNTFTRDNVLRREVILSEGDVYDQSLMEFSVLKLNQSGYFDPIDDEKDLDIRTDEERGEVDVNVKVAERGRQQISFNGGLAGAAGSFFGFDYSTNNLLGRGESLSFQVAFGNRQRSFLFSFTEPYIKDRPISVGFSLFTESRKFFGEGTFLSSNVDAITGASGSPLDFLATSDENLFTQKSTGASVFASAPLSEFYNRRSPFSRASRIGLSYSLSRSSVEDPPVNTSGDATQIIPRIFSQPDIVTSRVTPTFVYDTRNGSIDPTQGRQVSASIGFAGLGGDVRTYQFSSSFMQFFPVRRKRSEHPEVFGFRLIGGHVGSFAKSGQVRLAEQSSLSFINGVPIFERYYLGDEFTIRGYNVRSIAPLVPLDVFISSRNVVVSTSPTGPSSQLTTLPTALRDQLTALGTFTGPGGANSFQLPQRDARFLGADTQLLGNFEYRIPIVGRTLGFALFADIGSAFNLRTKDDQTFSTEFLADDPFIRTLGIGGLSQLVLASNPALAPAPLTGGLVLRDNRLVTREELTNAFRIGPTDPVTGLPFGFREIFLRGDVQQNTVARISESLFQKSATSDPASEARFASNYPSSTSRSA